MYSLTYAAIDLSSESLSKLSSHSHKVEAKTVFDSSSANIAAGTLALPWELESLRSNHSFAVNCYLSKTFHR
jgi:hypothetical protein